MVTSSRLLARNTLLNLLGQVVPMAAAVVAIPILIAHLGAARFGVLTLAWAAIGYFGLFDLGLGRALTQAVAARLGDVEGADDLGEVTWTALWLMLALGIAGAVIVSACTPWIVEHGLHVPPALQHESRTAFYLLAISLPFVVTSSGLRGILEAHQHFGLGTALRIPIALVTFLGPLAVLPFSSSLGPVVGALVVGRLLSWLAYLVACIWRYEFLRERLRIRRGVVVPLIRYGGWMTVSNIVSPLMAYLDRFVIGAMLPLVAVAHYVTPYEVVSKLLVLPLAMIAVLFPAFAATFATDRVRTAQLFERAVRVIVLTMFPVMLVIVLFAREGLTLWVGRDFASASTVVLQWLAIGIFVNAVAQAPFAVVQGIGRPDITAKLHLAELPLYLAGMWWLAHRFGIAGVAVAWTARAALDAGGLLFAAHRFVPEPEGRLQRTLLGAAGALGALLAATLVQGALPRIGYLAVMLIAFGVLGWRRAIQPAERAVLLEWSRFGRGRSAPNT
jgi:O-antigen/teichoic acid export membrane protein